MDCSCHSLKCIRQLQYTPCHSAQLVKSEPARNNVKTTTANKRDLFQDRLVQKYSTVRVTH